MPTVPDRRKLAARRHADGVIRCAWCPEDPMYVAYHDQEWGVALKDDRRLFEMLCLEGAQAGLSWITVLRKRERYRLVFDNFDAAKMARYDAARRAKLLKDPGIIRNRLKVNAFIENARTYLDVLEHDGSFSDYLWQFTGGKTLKRRPATLGEVQATSKESDLMSKTLGKRGFKFVGSTICYAFMQAVGMVDEHQKNCFAAKR